MPYQRTKVYYYCNSIFTLLKHLRTKVPRFFIFILTVSSWSDLNFLGMQQGFHTGPKSPAQQSLTTPQQTPTANRQQFLVLVHSSNAMYFLISLNIYLIWSIFLFSNLKSYKKSWMLLPHTAFCVDGNHTQTLKHARQVFNHWATISYSWNTLFKLVPIIIALITL